ncbi:MAG: potassium channel family protein [Chloroflexota bacterium]
MAWVEQIVGALLVLLALEDVFFTALFPGNYRGVVQIPLSRGFWRWYRWATRALPQFRERLLTYTGPLLILFHVVLWLLMLTVGFALIAWPHLGSTIRATQGPTSTGFVTALYFSGYSLTTLGTGDVVATSGALRMMMVLEAFAGFGSITLALTYFLAVYSALIRRSTFAVALYSRCERTPDATVLLAHLGAGGEFTGSRSDVGAMATALLEVTEAHRYYPILRYFHFHQTYNSLPRLLFVILDTAALIGSALDRERYRRFVESAAVAELRNGGLHALSDLCATLCSPAPDRAGAGAERSWRDRYQRSLHQLNAAGIATERDVVEGAERYVALRQEWEPSVQALARYLGYSWEAIFPTEEGAIPEGYSRRP